MEVRSIYKYARISPLKARDVAREIQGLPVSAALETLQFTPKKSAGLIEKTLKSAIANAENNHDLMPDTLVVSSAMVGEGPSFRRFKPRARGSASPIQKRTSHITIVVTDDIELPEPKKKGSKSKGSAKKTGSAQTTGSAGADPKPQVEPETTPTDEASDPPASASSDGTESTTTGETEKA